ncbi:helix-turn-helix domain-containing protein [Polaribacter sp.]|uniref:helix-turn-helix domain-containing protein n=1 Tax=Polaribacter sp. TaxID=1920175 RepID=UPI003F6C2203
MESSFWLIICIFTAAMNNYYQFFIKDQHKAVLNKVQKLRLEKGISLHDMGDKLALSESGYFKIEKGKTRLDIERFLIILKILGVSPKQFFEDID